MKIIKNLTFAALAALAATLLFQTSITRAGGHGQKDNRDHRDAIITWTKHVPEFLPPGGEIFATIAGTAGGDIGDATLVGEAFNPRVPVPGGVTFEADYHFIGSKHSLTVHFRTVQGPDQNGVVRGVITGFVKDGWLKGNVVEGEYTGYPCDQGVAGLCFDGTFVIKKGSKNKD